MKGLILFLCCLFPLTPCQKVASVQPYPNVVYILADDMGYGDIRAFNEDCKIETPYLDQLAVEGMKFTDAHSPSSVCTPTRYALLTGRYSWRSRLKSGVLTGISKALIPKGRTTVASMLNDHGYRTAFIGKWHLGWNWQFKKGGDELGSGWNHEDFEHLDYTQEVEHTPDDVGFDYSYGHAGSLDMAPYVYVENGQVTSLPDRVTVDTGKYTWWRKGHTGADFDHYDVTPNFFRRSIEFIETEARTPDPFFLYLALPSPHTPILPTEKYLGKSKLNPYADFIMLIDDWIGALQHTIKEQGIEQNTLFIFTTDNGCSPEADFALLDSLGHHPSYVFRGHKADIYEGGHRVPFIAKWPAAIQPGIISEEIICHTDLLATCAEIINVRLNDNEGEDSYSILPVLKGLKLKNPIREATVHHSIDGSFAIRKGNWKLILCPGSGGWSVPRPDDPEANEGLPGYQLYNLKNDPGEKENLLASHPDVVQDLKSLLTKYIEEGRSTPGKSQSNDNIDGEWKQIGWMD